MKIALKTFVAALCFLVGIQAQALTQQQRDNLNKHSPYYNLTPTNVLPTIRAAIKNGTRGSILCAGDSTTLGVSANLTSYTQTYPYQLYQDLLAAGFPAVFDSTVGYNIGTDARVVYTGSAAVNNTFGNIASVIVLSTSATMAFTPADNVDTFDIYYLTGSITGTAPITIDGGATLATITNISGANGISIATVTATLGAHTVKISNTSGSTIIQLIDAYNSAGSSIRIIGLGEPGATAFAYQQGGGYNPLGFISTFHTHNSAFANATLYNIGINDWVSGDLVNFGGFYTTFYNGAIAAGNFLGIGPNSSQNSTTPEAVQLQYIAVEKQLAYAKGFPFVNIRDRMGTWAQANAAGYMNNNTLHPTASGYALIAALLATPIAAPGFTSP